MIPSVRLSLIALTLLAFILRLPLLNHFAFHPDEAIYSYWALHFLRDDPMFLSVWPDKPPIFIWLLAGTFQLFGVGEASARWLNIAASTLAVPVVAATGRALWGRRAGLIAGVALAFNPFALSFAPTTFTDPTLVLFGSASLLLAVRGRPFWSGLWLAVAIMTKQQGVLYIPLIVAVLSRQLSIVNCQLTIDNYWLVRSLRFLLGLALIIAPILYWDSLRWAVAPSPWDLSAQNYGGLRWLSPSQWGQRMAAWEKWLWYLGASWWVWGLLGMMGIAASIRTQRVSKTLRVFSALRLPSISLILVVWSLTFFLLHLTTNVQPWDRYLLPLAPILALLVGATWSSLWREFPRLAAALLAALLLAWTPTALAATQGRLPLGGDHGAWSGLPAALAWVQNESPTDTTNYPTVIHHDQLGWHLRFYLYDELADGDIEARWFPSPVALIDDVAKRPADQRQFLIVPDWSPLEGLVVWAQMRNVQIETRARFGAFTVYEFFVK